MQTAVDFVARCLSGSALASLGGVKFVQLTEEEYKALETKDPNTIYYVYTDGGITQYMGDTKLSSGNAIVEGLLKYDSYQSILSNITVEEM